MVCRNHCYEGIWHARQIIVEMHRTITEDLSHDCAISVGCSNVFASIVVQKPVSDRVLILQIDPIESKNSAVGF